MNRIFSILNADYGIRLTRLGYRFVHLPDCYFNHKISASAKNNAKTSYIKLQSQVLFMKRYGKCFLLFFIGKLLYLMLSKRDFQGIKNLITFSMKKQNEESV